MKRVRAAGKEKTTRDPVDLPRVLEEPDDASALFDLPSIDLEELAIRGLRREDGSYRRLEVISTLFESVSFARTSFQTAEWRDVRFARCDLANVSIRAVSGIRVELVECRMTGVN